LPIQERVESTIEGTAVPNTESKDEGKSKATVESTAAKLIQQLYSF